MTAPDFAALVAAVLDKEPHDPDCAKRVPLPDEAIQNLVGKTKMAPLWYACTCDREALAIAKVGRGIWAAVEEAGMYSDIWTDHERAAAARAFEEASR